MTRIEFDFHSIRRVLIEAARLLVYLEDWMILTGSLKPEKKTIITFFKGERYKPE